MPQQAAGLLMCRKQDDKLEFFLVHPGGPFWSKKNEGAWSIPKGLVEPNEALLAAAQREFREETGIEPVGPFQELGEAKMKSGKVVHVWSFIGEWQPEDGITSNYISVEWPPRSGKFISVPEVEKGAWMNYREAKVMINPGQVIFLERALALH